MHEQFINEDDPLEKIVARIIEECGEVVFIYGKAKRFGWGSSNPLLPEEERETNYEIFTKEVKDLKHAIDHFHNRIGDA